MLFLLRIVPHCFKRILSDHSVTEEKKEQEKLRIIPLPINEKHHNLRYYYKRNTSLGGKRELGKFSRCTEKTANYEHDSILEMKRCNI